MSRQGVGAASSIIDSFTIGKQHQRDIVNALAIMEAETLEELEATFNNEF